MIGAAAGGQLLGLAPAVGLRGVQFVFAGSVAEISDPLAVRAPRRIALGDAAGTRQIASRALRRRQRPNVAAGFDECALAGGGDVPGSQVLAHVHLLGANLRAGAGYGYFDGSRLPAGQVEQEQVAAVLVDDLASAVRSRADRRPFDVEVRSVSDLHALLAGDVIRPNVQTVRRAGVAQVVHFVAVPHWLGVGAFPVGDLLRRVILEVEEPNVGGHSAAVAFPSAVIARVRRIRKPLAIGTDGAVSAVGHGQLSGQPALRGHGEQLRLAPQAGKAVAEIQQLAIRRPVAERFGRGVMRHAVGHPAVRADGV